MTILLCLGYMVIPGLLPARRLTGSWSVAPAVAPLVTCLIAAVAGIAAMMTSSQPLLWFGAIVLVANVAIFVPAEVGRKDDWVRPAAVGVVLVLAVLPFLSLLRFSVGQDARFDWLAHARWYFQGGSFLRSTLLGTGAWSRENDYPPLVHATVGIFWALRGRIDYRSGQIVIALANASALASLGLIMTRVLRRSTTLARVTAAVGLAWIGYGIAGSNATNAYADLLWSAAAAIAVTALLLGPRDPVLIRIGLLALFVSALTKNEGFGAAMIIAFLTGIRMRREISRGWPVMGAILAGLAAWPLTVRILGVRGKSEPSNLVQLLRHPAALYHESEVLISGIFHLFWPWLFVALGVAVLGATFFGAERRQQGLGSPLFAWAAMTGMLVFVSVGYLATGPPAGAPMEYWVSRALPRAGLGPILALTAETFIWAGFRVGGARTRRAPGVPTEDALTSVRSGVEDVGLPGQLVPIDVAALKRTAGPEQGRAHIRRWKT